MTPARNEFPWGTRVLFTGCPQTLKSEYGIAVDVGEELMVVGPIDHPGEYNDPPSWRLVRKLVDPLTPFPVCVRAVVESDEVGLVITPVMVVKLTEFTQ